MHRFTMTLLAAVIASGAVTGQAPPAGGPGPESARAVHLLQRITYGPRPGDVDRVLAVGVDQFLARQLTADGRDDPALAAGLRRYPVLGLTSTDLGGLYDTIRRQLRERRRMAAQGDPRMTPAPPDDPTPEQRTFRRHLADFRQVTALRAIRADAQLFEIMVDFWTNHFNVYAGSGPVRFLFKDHVEEVIRPRALGRFEDLLIATARSPAMLLYLDNASSVAPGSVPPPVARARERLDQARERARRAGNDRAAGRIRQARERLRRAQRSMPSGLNENYARELLELHTLGVDGGYRQADVEAVARIFTGWSVERPPRGTYQFVFNAWAHDRGAKRVLGEDYPAGRGLEEGLTLLRSLARHPATRTHVSAKLCERFVAEPAPSGCVTAGVDAWRRSDGEIREVLRAILTSEDFWAPAHRGAKVKTPFEFLVSAVRALGVTPDSANAVVHQTRRLGHPLFEAEPPTGHPETREAWVSAGGLLHRLNLSLAVASGRLRGIRPALDSLIPLDDDVDAMAAAVNDVVLAGRASDHTLRVLRERGREIPRAAPRRVFMVGLALGSPEFQRQ